MPLVRPFVLVALTFTLLVSGCPLVVGTTGEGAEVDIDDIADCCGCLAVNSSEDGIDCLESADQDECTESLAAGGNVDISGESCITDDCETECAFLNFEPPD